MILWIVRPSTSVSVEFRVASTGSGPLNVPRFVDTRAFIPPLIGNNAFFNFGSPSNLFLLPVSGAGGDWKSACSQPRICLNGLRVICE
jgi:hypothetical protein